MSRNAAQQVDGGDGVATAFVEALGRIATGVTVVGSVHPGHPDGHPDGRADGSGWVAQTVSAMCSVSVQPPLILVCVNRRSPINAVIERSGVFCVSALATQHDHVADTFAGRPWPGKDRWDFTCGHWEAAPSGAPRLTDALAAFDCAVHSVVAAGTHLVYLGAVREVVGGTGAPLVYANRGYAAPSPVSPSRFPEFPDAHPDNRFSPATSTNTEVTR
ncbi:MAG TPA: flavin reductase family protein [Pseudonocardia sp.]|nr:flavin reductase family protein [Pseudonocardia sp.]